jgi:hypothetical protein
MAFKTTLMPRAARELRLNSRYVLEIARSIYSHTHTLDSRSLVAVGGGCACG